MASGEIHKYKASMPNADSVGLAKKMFEKDYTERKKRVFRH
jgi:hypothetical protein